MNSVRRLKLEKGKVMARNILESGKALEKFREIIAAQGGQSDIKPDEIPLGEFKETILSEDSGYITKVDNGTIVEVAKNLGHPVDKGAGLLLNYKVGDCVEKDDVIVELYAESKERLLSAKRFLDYKQDIPNRSGSSLKDFPDLR